MHGWLQVGPRILKKGTLIIVFRLS